MSDLPAPLAGVKGKMQIHDPRALLKKEYEAKSAGQKGDIQLRVEMPQRLQGLETRLTALETTVTEKFAAIMDAVERIEQSSAHVEVRRGPGRPRKVEAEPEDEG